MTGQSASCYPEAGENASASPAADGLPPGTMALADGAQALKDDLGIGDDLEAAAAPAGDQTAHAARAAALREKRPRAQRGKVAVAWLVNAVKQLGEPHGSAPHDVAKFAARALGLSEQQLDLPVRLGLARAQRQGLLQRASAGKYMLASNPDVDTAGCGVPPPPCRKRVKRSCSRPRPPCPPKPKCKKRPSSCKPRYYYYYYCRRKPAKCPRKKQKANASCCCKSKSKPSRPRCPRPRPRCQKKRKKSCPRKKKSCPRKKKPKCPKPVTCAASEASGPLT